MKLPAVEKQVNKHPKIKQTTSESMTIIEDKPTTGRSVGGGPSRGTGMQHSTRTSAALAQQGITATGLQERSAKTPTGGKSKCHRNQRKQ